MFEKEFCFFLVLIFSFLFLYCCFVFVFASSSSSSLFYFVLLNAHTEINHLNRLIRIKDLVISCMRDFAAAAAAAI